MGTVSTSESTTTSEKEMTRSIKKSPHVAWRVVLFVLAGLIILASVLGLILGNVGDQMKGWGGEPEEKSGYGKDNHFPGWAPLPIGFFGGIVAIASIICATQHTVLAWTIAHYAFFCLHLFALITLTSSSANLVGIPIAVGILAALQLLFVCIFTPLNRLKGLKRMRLCCEKK